MQIASVLNVHSQPDLIRDTIDSISTYMTEKILVLVDGASWVELKDQLPNVAKVEGFYHNVPKSPYRNVALALQTAAYTYPDVDWYCYSEPDVLFGSDRFKHNLKAAEEKKVWMLGNDGHVSHEALPLIQAMLNEPFKSSYYLLGCCLFFYKDFIKKLLEIDFFERFLTLTNGFEAGFFPFYDSYDLSENLYPTLCRHFGGNIGVFATFDHEKKWHGAYEYFPVRWRPELDAETENFPNASIMHPLKTYDHPIRVLHREKRKLWKDLKQKEKHLGCSLTYPSDIQKLDDASLMS